MKIGVPKEIKNQEGRVALTPDAVAKLVALNHQVFVETEAGKESGYDNDQYAKSGAKIVNSQDAWNVELVIKVKEPLKQEYQYLNGQIVFTFLHLAGVDPELAQNLLETKTTGIAYELVEDADRRLPLLAPMSAVAGNMATLVGNYFLAKFNGGKGTLLGSILGESHGKVLIIGDGVVGIHAANVASAMGADVYLAGLNEERMKSLNIPRVKFIHSDVQNLEKLVVDSDLVVGAVLRRGDKTPKIVSEQMIISMSPGSVVVDVSIDQGGCIETSVPTTHSDPVFIKHDVVHYCVANMPGAYPRTSTNALVKAMFPFLLKIVQSHDLKKQLDTIKGLDNAILTYEGWMTNQVVARSLNIEERYRELNELTG